MANNPHMITRQFEEALCEYTGARYAVAVNSCTMAIFLALKWHMQPHHWLWKRSWEFQLPCRTYIGVAQSVIHAGARIEFIDREWHGGYCLSSSPVFDFARRFTSGMYRPSEYQCVSFHSTKILGDSQGGAILHDSADADEWFRRARFDGRREGVNPKQDDPILGWHCYMSPDVATRLLWKLRYLPAHNDDLPNDDYPDLSKFKIFR